MTVLKTSRELFSVHCYLSDDKLKLYMDVKPQSPLLESDTKEDLSERIEAELCELLEQHVKPERIDLGVLRDIINSLTEGEEVQKRLICRGKKPGQARDGKIVFLVRRLAHDKKVEVDEKGFADFRELHLFDNIEVNQIVARVYPPKPGTDGEDALGNPIPGPEGNSAEYSLDKSLTVLPAGETNKTYDQISSSDEGYLFQNQKQLAVLSELKISTDIDYNTGNIDFIGSIVVKGDVKPGFTVRGKKGVQIGGSITGATITSSEGDIVIKGSTIGTAGGAIVAHGCVEMRNSHDATVDAGQGILIHKSAQGSTLRSRSTIHFPNGSLVGGDTFTVCGLEAAEIGNSSGATTRIFLCSDVETTPEYRALLASIDQHNKAIELLQMHLGPLARNPARLALLNHDVKKNMQAMLVKLETVTSSLTKKINEQQEMLQKASASSTVRVNYQKSLFPGAQIFFTGGVYEPQEPMSGPQSLELNSDRSALDPSELLPLECSISKVNNIEETS